MKTKTRLISEQHRAANAEAQRRAWSDPACRERRLAAIRAPETRAKVSQGMRLSYARRLGRPPQEAPIPTFGQRTRGFVTCTYEPTNSLQRILTRKW